MSQLRRRHETRKAMLDITPMVDVSLTLVVFLLLTSENMDISEIPVTLPQASTGQAAEKNLYIQIDDTGQIYLDQQAYDIKALLKQMQGVDRVTIQADHHALHGRVTEVLDALRRSGIRHIFYGVEAVDTW